MAEHMKDGPSAPRADAGASDRTLEGTADPGARLFLDFLSSIRPQIDASLERRWRDKVRDVERYGREVAAMAAEAKSLTLRGGKRFRAGLLVAAYQGVAPDAPLEPAIDAGVALELLQTYLLIQDDWIDGDTVRRGDRTVHVALAEVLGDVHLGASSAILAGDLTWSFALGALASAAAPPDRALAAVQLFCRMHEDVVIGQHLDVVGRAEDVEQMHALKTGSYTVRGPLALGATLAGASAEVVAALERFAAPVGVAFQLRDDLLGAFGSAAATGKPVGNDLRAGKRTAVLAAAEGRLDAAGRGAVARALGQKDASDEAVAAATLALEACGARRVVEERLSALCGEAEDLGRALPVTEHARRILSGAASALRWKGA
ncbi:polyprenyl synthetase family protein [Sorangium sp. So ce131]|uniref:polyprenyl synthetase family protein n=1 Tax=Sorangium sp. So ce131 TaxID=3133282 RepID=UPI003F61EFDF